LAETLLRINSVKNLLLVMKRRQILHCVQNDVLIFYRKCECVMYIA
jgi:hypothetical protein